MKQIKAADFMDRSPLAFRPDMGVIVAVRHLLAEGLSGAPVVDADNALIGFLSEADCMRGTLMGGYYTSVGELVRDRMTHEVETVSPDADIVDVAQAFLVNNRRVLPVVSGGKVVGLIQRSSVLSTILELIDQRTCAAA